PLQEPLDLVALAFWLTAAAQLLTWFGTSGVIRYSLTFFGPLPLLVTAVLGRVARRGRAGEVAALALAGALLVFNLLTQVAFVRAGTSDPVRPVDAVIARMTALGATACYADSRISQVISFESTGRIVCADYVGLRDYASLRSVDAVETPASVAPSNGASSATMSSSITSCRPIPASGRSRRPAGARAPRRMRSTPPWPSTVARGRAGPSRSASGSGSRSISARLGHSPR